MWKKEFDASFVGFMKDGAQWLVDNTDIKLVGELQNRWLCTINLIRQNIYTLLMVNGS